MNILLYGNGGAGNHGCEAIVRGSAVLLNGQNLQIRSGFLQEDQHYGLEQLARLTPARHPIKKNFAFLSAYLKLKLQKNYVEMDGLSYLPAIREDAASADLALSVGGDNYCYDGTELYPYLNRAYHKAGIKTILWGCSVEPDRLKDPAIARDLALYDAIVARESITYEAVKNLQAHTFLAPDPAFLMAPAVCELDPRFSGNAVIGINASPMILRSETVQGAAYQNYRNLIAHILNTTDAVIALIPHVVWSSSDDRSVLRQLRDEFHDSDRIILVEDHTAPELKYIISKCTFFIGARTHSTIAAYSSCVPTLVVGYSVKARGIARDLFGTETGYVLPVQSLRQPNQLAEAFTLLWQNKDQIRTHLHDFLPGYLQQAVSVRDSIFYL